MKYHIRKYSIAWYIEYILEIGFLAVGMEVIIWLNLELSLM